MPERHRRHRARRGGMTNTLCAGAARGPECTGDAHDRWCCRSHGASCVLRRCEAAKCVLGAGEFTTQRRSGQPRRLFIRCLFWWQTRLSADARHKQESTATAVARVRLSFSTLSTPGAPLLASKLHFTPRTPSTKHQRACARACFRVRAYACECVRAQVVPGR